MKDDVQGFLRQLRNLVNHYDPKSAATINDFIKDCADLRWDPDECEFTATYVKLINDYKTKLGGDRAITMAEFINAMVDNMVPKDYSAKVTEKMDEPEFQDLDEAEQMDAVRKVVELKERNDKRGREPKDEANAMVTRAEYEEKVAELNYLKQNGRFKKKGKGKRNGVQKGNQKHRNYKEPTVYCKFCACMGWHEEKKCRKNPWSPAFVGDLRAREQAKKDFKAKQKQNKEKKKTGGS